MRIGKTTTVVCGAIGLAACLLIAGSDSNAQEAARTDAEKPLIETHSAKDKGKPVPADRCVIVVEGIGPDAKLTIGGRDVGKERRFVIRPIPDGAKYAYDLVAEVDGSTYRDRLVAVGGERIVLRPAGSTDAAESPDVMAIRATANAFIDAFDAGDAKAIAALWTEKSEYVDETGQRITGRDAIERKYVGFFAANPGAKIRLTVESIRVVNEDMAIEDGIAALDPLPAGPPAYTRYTAIHVRKNAKWLIAFARDMRVEVPSNHPWLSDLEFLVGSWRGEEAGVTVDVIARWIAGKNLLERTFTVRKGDEVVSTAKEVIDWDALNGRIVSRLVTSDGGHSVGVWTPHDNGWQVATEGVLIDGTPTAATIWLSLVDAGAMAWESVDRTKGNRRLPDMRQVVLKRRR